MANLGGIYIAGKEISPHTYEHFSSGVVFALKDTPKVEQIWESDDAKWQVEIRKDVSEIFVRSREPMDYESIVTFGLEQAQRCLDILAVKRIAIINISSPEVNNVSVYQDEKGNYILRHFLVSSFGLTVKAEVEVRDKDGNIKPSPPIPKPEWTWAFRYYRLSQASQNIFEAYRNLFLSLEAILNEICPQQPREGERKWLKRALSTLSVKINYSHYVPSTVTQPIDYLIKTQYTDVRCRLFHAKFPYALLPHSELNSTNVLTAYDILARLWLDIAQNYFNVPRGGGVVTYQGFKWLMDKVFSKPLVLYFTEDCTPPKEEDTNVSPLGMAIYSFAGACYLGQTQLGFVAWQGKLAALDKYKNTKIHRICTALDDTLFDIAFIEEGLTPCGVDIFETYQSMRLVNTSQPKTQF